MDFLLAAPLVLVLVALALLDGLSVGTLLIPVFLLLSPGRVRAGRILLYLAAITLFYPFVGLLFLWGLVNVIDVAGDVLSSQPGLIVRLFVGVGMLVGSFFFPGSKKRGGKKKDAAADELAASPPPGRLTRWRDRMLDPATTPAAVVGVAIAAGIVEVATMLPYLIAMTMLAGADLSTPLRIAALAGYCLVMIAPALVLLVVRLMAARAVERPLRRLSDWLSGAGSETTAWIVGIAGFLIARGAASELGLFSGIDKLFSGLGGG